MGGFSFSMVLWVKPLMLRTVTGAKKNSLPILMMRMAMTGTLLICQLVLTLTLVPVFAEISMPFASYAVSRC